MVFITFWGKPHTSVSSRPGKAMVIPLVILAFFSIVTGFLELPHNLGHITLFSGFLSPVLPAVHDMELPAALEWISQGIAAVLTIGGIWLAHLFFIRKPQLLPGLDRATTGLQAFFYRGWDLDRLYNILFVRPFKWLARVNQADVTDRFYTGLAWLNVWLHRQVIKTQSGILRWYLAGAAIGALIILTISVLL